MNYSEDLQKKEMADARVFGIVEFSYPLMCAADVLGQKAELCVAETEGTLLFPSLPNWGEDEHDPLRKPLLAPRPAQKWIRVEEQISWGRPVSYPSGISSLEAVLVEFLLPSEDTGRVVQEIYAAFPSWLSLFWQYAKLMTKQETGTKCSSSSEYGQLRLFSEKDAVIKFYASSEVIYLRGRMPTDEKSLHLEQLKKAARYSSDNRQPTLEHRLLLEAYDARSNEDFRKAVIESVNAVEVCLTSCIDKKLDVLCVPFGNKLMSRFRTLGGRLELCEILGIPLPKKDYKSLILEPRNAVMHKGVVPSKAQADQVISEAEELLRSFSPELHESKQETRDYMH